ncbi:1-acyl-sn-glycerol-3-phosphate acyltransferase, partial [Pseudomonas syringae pv. tagetis]|uniref:1-acyl-sn-glycerol-3-phosphate acyltransferase n=1 Tax=Pseudomonas syringae group genomosp. 7 TaxID=251699 RepID=UPI00376FC691
MEMLDADVDRLQTGLTLIIFPVGTRTQGGQPPVFHRGAAAIALRGASVITPVAIKVQPTALTKAERWYRVPPRRGHGILR